MSILIENVSRRFGTFTALKNVSLNVAEGELLALLGPSGSGKTTLLRIIAGLDFPDDGMVRVHNDDVSRLSARDRNVGFVFQHYALFRHLTVFENVAFGLRIRGEDSKVVNSRVNELLSLVKLADLGSRYPTQLSGGQRQRVALARALAPRPRVLLLDEPFGALDARVRSDLRQWLRRLHDEMPVTTVFVTHDQEEAFEVSDRVVVMNAGKVEQQGTPQEVFDHPANPFVMDFLGQVNVFHGRIHEGKAFLAGAPHEKNGHDSAQLYIRPHELDVERVAQANSLRARVKHVNPAGAITRVHIELPDFGMEISVELTRDRSAELDLQKGEDVYVAPRKFRVFTPDYAI
jgi:sulfate transport system ATP-binding protein